MERREDRQILSVKDLTQAISREETAVLDILIKEGIEEPQIEEGVLLPMGEITRRRERTKIFRSGHERFLSTVGTEQGTRLEDALSEPSF